MSDFLFYDKTDKYSIEKYAQGLVGKTFREICSDITNNVFNKGGLGTALEESYFHYAANNISAPDFIEAGVELKTAGYIITKHGYKSKERLVLSMIDYMTVIEETDFESSHFWYKNRMLLLVFYLYQGDRSRLDFLISYARLFSPSEQDLVQIREDYAKIIKKIQIGRAHELSEADTMYLGACTKSSDSHQRRKQPYSDTPAKPRAFAYKVSYMTYVLNNRIRKERPLYEKIAKSEIETDLETYVINRINAYKGKSMAELCRNYNVSSNAKQLQSMLALRILDVKSSKAEEFVKANVTVKAVRIEENGKIIENMSFPVMKFRDIAVQEFEESDFYDILTTNRFLLVIYRKRDGEYHLEGAKFWNMPMSDIEGAVRDVWEKTRYVLRHISDIQELHNGRHYIGIFPHQTENDVCHVRPHGRDSMDTDVLPDGRQYPKQCFWIDRHYIKHIIDED